MIGNLLSRLLTLMLALALLLPVRGPSAAQADSDARDVIAQALALLHEADSYAYTAMMDTTNQLTDESGQAFGVRQVYEISGETSGDDYHDTTMLTVTPLEAEDDTQTATLERVQVGGTLFVLLGDLLAEELNVEAGWWALDDLLETIGEDSVRRFSAEQLATLPTPASIVLEDDLIRGVEEVEASQIDGLPVRVFDVEMKAVEMAARQTEGDALQRLAETLENASLVLQSDIRLTYRLYIGAEDGRLYRVESESRTHLPFLEAAGSGSPGYNVDNTSHLTLDISAYGEPVNIQAPANVAG